MAYTLPPLMIGEDLTIPVPIIQGGMGVKVSMMPLVSAVADCGGAGTIASVGLGFGTEGYEKNFVVASRESLITEIRKGRDMTKGVIGANVMVALSNYEDLVRASVCEQIDFIASGAGLPFKLPEYTEGSTVKLIPIVSSARAAHMIIKTWKRRYNRVPDAFIVEGPLAGGHLGFSYDDIVSGTAPSLESLVGDMVALCADYTGKNGKPIPVIAAGGVYTGTDIANFLRLGAQGVQMGTRFVATVECPVHHNFKMLYCNATEDDVVIIKSPVGMPGRAVKTKFIDEIERGTTIPFQCLYRCLRSCDPTTVPYCIAKALTTALSGDLDNAVVFAGANVARITDIVPVPDLMERLIAEATETLSRQP